MATNKKRSRLSIDVTPEERRRIRMAAVMRDLSIRQYVLEAVEKQLAKDLKAENQDGLLFLTTEADPVLAELWDNERDAAYGGL